MAGDARTGVTIHRTTAELDAGPIAAQEAFDIRPEDDAGAVYARAAEVAAARCSTACSRTRSSCSSRTKARLTRRKSREGSASST